MKLAIFGMFRSGTGYLWWLLSQDPRFKHCYTEPLHPLLLYEMEKYDHYAIYKGLPELEKYFDPDFSFNKYRLEYNEEYPELKAYLKYLLQDDTLIKINRMPLRIGWFMFNFSPDIKCVGIIRDPRACAYGHLNYRFDGAWDSVFFDLCASYPQYANYLNPLKNKAPHVKLIAFWRICAEHMYNWFIRTVDKQPIIRLEDLNADEPKVIADLYRSLDLDVPPELAWEAKNPSDYAFFWGGKENLLYQDVPRETWREAIRIAKAEDMMNLYGYEI